jgi:hypothetical protein
VSVGQAAPQWGHLIYAGHVVAMPQQDLVGLLLSLHNGLGLLGDGVTCGSSGADKDLQSRRQLVGRQMRCSRCPVALCGDTTREILVDFGRYMLVTVSGKWTGVKGWRTPDARFWGPAPPRDVHAVRNQVRTSAQASVTPSAAITPDSSR